MPEAFSYGSVCSGIEAATVAWHPLGWKPAFFSEIEAFPRAILSHHYPSVPLHGDFTTIEADQYGAIDLLVGGTPCQDFSVAGQRAGLGGERGNLTLEFSRLAYRKRPQWLVWENVPGAFSLNKGRDFGAVIACFAGYPAGSLFEPPADGWRSAGVVPPAGPGCYGLAWRVLDAQYAGVPQRRRRIFVVGYLGDWRPAAAVLFERESLLGNPPPRREARQDVAPTISARPSGGGGLGTDFDCDGGLVAGTLNANGKAAGSATQQDAETGMLVARATPLNAIDGNAHSLVATSTAAGYCDATVDNFVAHALRGEGFDASEDGTGRGTPLVPVAFTVKDYGADALSDLAPTLRAGGHSSSHANAGVMPAITIPIQEVGKRTGVSTDDPRAGIGIGADQDPMFTLQSGAQHAVMFSIMPQNSGKDYTARQVEISQPLMAGGPVGGNQGGDFVVESQPMSFQERGRADGRNLEVGGDVAYALTAPKDGGRRQEMNVAVATAVRRLTPRECERLQGFPDDYTLIPYRGGQSADGPRYKALGNSMAVPVMAWLGQRIEFVREILAARGAA